MGIVKKQNSRDQIINYILSKIESGELKSGDKLINEREFSEQLGVSRVPLREAICALSTLGILEAKQGDGTFVSSYNPDLIGKVIRTYSLFDRSLIEEIFEARRILEADAAKLAAGNRTSEDLEKIQKVLQEHAEIVQRYTKNETEMKYVLEYDNYVHLGIAAAAHNNFFLQIINTIRYVGQSRHIFRSEYTINQHHFEESVGYHRNIFEAIRRQDGDAAYQAMSEHILHIQSSLDMENLKKVIDK